MPNPPACMGSKGDVNDSRHVICVHVNICMCVRVHAFVYVCVLVCVCGWQLRPAERNLWSPWPLSSASVCGYVGEGGGSARLEGYAPLAALQHDLCSLTTKDDR